MSAPIWLFDLDSSLADFEADMLQKMQAMASPAEAEAYSDFSCFLWPHKSPDWFKARKKLIKRQPGFWANLPLIEFGMDLYREAGVLGYDRVVVTKAPFSNADAWTEKVVWCRKHIPEAKVIIGDDREFKGQVRGDVLYDDYPPYIRSWLAQHPVGKVLMLDGAQNREFEHPQVLRCYRTPFAGQHNTILNFLRGQ